MPPIITGVYNIIRVNSITTAVDSDKTLFRLSQNEHAIAIEE